MLERHSPQSTRPLILQFGTSRFLQAHVDLFVSKSLEEGLSTAPVYVVQSSTSEAGIARVSAMNESKFYPVKIQGLQNGEVIDRVEEVSSIDGALQANTHWESLVDLFCHRVTHVVSNTADQGYQLSDDDNLKSVPPKSYPAKLLSLLYARFEVNQQPVTMMPCELVANNGSVLKALIVALAKKWDMSVEFVHWLEHNCLWINSLVDRIVSEPIDPLGAVAEPYALWAIENQPNLVLPCHHDAIRVVDDLAPLEWLKLSILNLSHTYLVDIWQQEPSDIKTVAQIMNDPVYRERLEIVLRDEVIPVLHAMNLGEDIFAYVENVRERFLNPFLDHQLSDIAGNHQSKVERRILPIYLEARKLLPSLTLHHLSACLNRNKLLPGETT